MSDPASTNITLSLHAGQPVAPNGTADPKLRDLVSRWNSLMLDGQPAIPEKLCADCPELLDPLRKEIEALLQLHRLLDLTASHFQLAPTGTAPPDQAEVTLTQPAVTGVARLPTISGYEVLGELGRGGMGVVYKARQLPLRRLVALKMILAGEHAGGSELERFRMEAEAVSRLQHPGIVQIYAVGQQEERPFLALEYVEGGTLSKRLGGTPLPPREAALLVEQLARAIQYAHEHGVVHRDLKPGNVLVAEASCPLVPGGRGAGGKVSALGWPLTGGGEGQPVSQSTISNPQAAVVKITDFGLAKQLDSSLQQTRSGAVMGTPSYMSPEQAAGNTRAVGPTADIYSLGAILYETLTGRPPFRAATTMETLLQVMHQEPVTPSQLQPKLPRDLETICLKCLQKDPHKRYASAHALAEDLRAFLDGREITARPVGRLEKARRWCRRNPALATASSLAVLALLVATVVSVLFGWHQAAALEESERLRGETESANRNLKETEARRRQFVRLSTKLALDRGLERYVLGQHADAALWFARALEIDEGANPDLDRTIRLNLGALTSKGEPARVTIAGEKEYPPQSQQVYYHQPNWYPRVTTAGHFAALALTEQLATVVDLRNGNSASPVYPHPVPIRQMALTADGRGLATLDARGQLRLWKAGGGPLAELGGNGGSGTLAFLAGDRILSSARETVVAAPPDKDNGAPAGGSPVVHTFWAVDTRKVVGVVELNQPAGKSSPPDFLWNEQVSRCRPHTPSTPDGAEAVTKPAVITLAPLGTRTLSWLKNEWRISEGFDGRVTLLELRSSLTAVSLAGFLESGCLLVLGQPGRVLIYNASTGKKVQEWEAARVQTVSPDHRYLALTDGGGKLVLFDGRNGKELVLPGKPLRPQALEFTPDSRRLLLQVEKEELVVVQLTPDAPQLQRVAVGEAPPNQGEEDLCGPQIAVEPDIVEPVPQRPPLVCWLSANGERALVERLQPAPGKPARRAYRLLDLSQGRFVGEPLVRDGAAEKSKPEALITSPAHAAFSPDGHWAILDLEQVAASGERTWWLLDASTGKHSRKTHKQADLQGWTADNQVLLQTPRTICYLKPPALEKALDFGLPAGESTPTRRLLADGLALSESAPGTTDRGQYLWLISAQTGLNYPPSTLEARIAAQLQHGRQVLLALRPAGEQLAHAQGTRLTLSHFQRPQEQLHQQQEHPILALVFSPDGRLVATGDAGGQIRIRGARTGKAVCPALQHQGPVWALAFTPDGRTLISASSDGTVRRWKVADGSRLGEPWRHEGPVWTLTLAGDGRLAASGGSDGQVRVWDLVTGAATGTLPHDAPVVQVAWSSDGKRLLAGTWKQQAHVWDIASGKRCCAPIEHQGSPEMVLLSGDGQQVVALAAPERIGVWQVDNPKSVFSLYHLAPVRSLALEPTQSLLAAGDVGGTLRLWDLVSGRLIAPAERRSEGAIPVCVQLDRRGLSWANAQGVVQRVELSMPMDETSVQVRRWTETRTQRYLDPEGKSLPAPANSAQPLLQNQLHQGALPAPPPPRIQPQLRNDMPQPVQGEGPP